MINYLQSIYVKDLISVPYVVWTSMMMGIVILFAYYAKNKYDRYKCNPSNFGFDNDSVSDNVF